MKLCLKEMEKITRNEAAEIINDHTNFADDLENYTDLNNARFMAIHALRDKATENQTEKYADMIENFECDFSLAMEPNGAHRLDDLQVKIERGDKRMLADIKLLQELSHGVRHGILKIVKQLEDERGE